MGRLGYSFSAPAMAFLGPGPRFWIKIERNPETHRTSSNVPRENNPGAYAGFRGFCPQNDPDPQKMRWPAPKKSNPERTLKESRLLIGNRREKRRSKRGPGWWVGAPLHTNKVATPVSKKDQMEPYSPLLYDPSELESHTGVCLLYTSPSPRDKRQSRMPSSA